MLPPSEGCTPPPPGPAVIPERVFLEGLAGRSVALVGAAGSAVGSGDGPAVDGHDVVVRVNGGCPVPAGLIPDLGARTDVLYHMLRYGQRPIGAADVAVWRTAGVMVVSAHPPEHRLTARLGLLADAAGLPWSTAGALRADLRARMRTMPNTGVVALAHLLASPLARLTVYGFDFYQSGHWLGQQGETAAEAVAQAGGHRGHHQGRHRRYVASLARTDRRLVLAPTVRAALGVRR